MRSKITETKFLIVILFLLAGCSRFCRVRSGQSLPHIVLVTVDTLRADHLSCYGYKRNITPHFDNLAREGVLFKDAFTSTPITLPAHTSIMTGLYPQGHGVHNNATYYLNPSATTLSEILIRAGYHTAAFVSAHVLHSRYGLNQGFEVYNDELPEEINQGVESLVNLYQERKAEETTNLALDWLAQHQQKPCFVWLHYFEPHAPYLPPATYAQSHIDQPYDGEIAYVDHCLGHLKEGLQKMKIYDRTVLVVTSDHGEGLGEHQEMTHGVFLYDTTLHIPLIMRLPGLISSEPVTGLCRNIDILPTILDYCRLPCPQSIQGKSLIPILKGGKMNLDLMMESRYANENFGWAILEGIRTPEWKYIKAPQPELYNIQGDQKEGSNLWTNHLPVNQELEQQWQKMYAKIGEEKEFESKTTALTPKMQEQMKSLGYIWFSSSQREKNKETGQIDPKDMSPILDKLDKGVLYYTMGKYDQAIQELGQLIQLNQENSMAHFHIACAYFLQGDLGKAREHFIKVTQLDSRHVDAHNYLGYIHGQLKEFDHAEAAFKQALALNPNYGEVHYNLGIVYYQQGKFTESLNEFQQATLLNPRHLEALYNLGGIYLETGRLTHAEQSLKQALALKENHPQAHNALGKVYNRQKEYEKAEQEFMAALRSDSDYKEAFNNLANVYIKQERYDEALEKLEQAVHLDPRFGEAYFNFAVVYRAKGQFSKALEYLEKAREAGLSGYDLSFTMGDTLLRLEKAKEAIEWTKQAIVLNPESWQAHFNLGAALYTGAETVDEAIEQYEKAVALHPPLAAPYINLGIVHFQRGDLSLAIELWQKALEVEPDNVEARIDLGVAYERQGLYEPAEEIYIKAKDIQPDNLKIYYNLSIVYLHQRKVTQAIGSLQEALKIDPGFAAAQKLLALAESQKSKEE